LALPLTGAASMAVPRSAAAARTSAEASSETVELSIRILGDLPERVSTPSLPSVTCFRSFDAEIMVKTISQEARSAGRSTTRMPDFVSGSALARVRFQTLTSAPAFARRSAIE
jgi:hypothetical protein